MQVLLFVVPDSSSDRTVRDVRQNDELYSHRFHHVVDFPTANEPCLKETSGAHEKKCLTLLTLKFQLFDSEQPKSVIADRWQYTFLGKTRLWGVMFPCDLHSKVVPVPNHVHRILCHAILQRDLAITTCKGISMEDCAVV